ncbi:uncharacterized protein LOC103355603, partial [Stegastes partitus]|uniref:Uncharacterized protein LOC103355603 n=2 Tax=Stegastes partitus TaxID=144197 RepID=A0A9Y4MXW7_9TELE
CSSYKTDEWIVVPDCHQIAFNSCNVAFTKAKEEHGCVMLRVTAESHGKTSKPAKACSRHGDSCTPDFSLTARPGSLTVQLTMNHSLAPDYAGQIKHRIYYGKGEQLEAYIDVSSSKTISELDQGQRYCVAVQYVRYDTPHGPRSCIQCELIPEAGYSTHTRIIVAVVVAVVLVAVITAVAHILIFHRKKIKSCLQPRYQMPHSVLEPLDIPNFTSSQTEEHCDVISSFTPEEIGGK